MKTTYVSIKNVIHVCTFFLWSVVSFNVSAQQNAIHLDGVNDHINLNVLSPHLSNVSNHFTFEFWMKGNQANHSSSSGTLFAINPSSADGVKLALEVDGLNSPNAFLRLKGDATVNISELIWESTDAVSNDVCHHIAFSYDGINQVAKVYIDGVLKATESLILNLTTDDLYTIGRSFNAAANPEFYTGLVSDFRFWDFVKSDAEIFQNMYTNYTGTESGILALYKFSQGVANGNNIAITSALDLSPNAFNGTYLDFAMTGGSSNFISSPCVANVSVLNGTMSQTINNICDGAACNYEGPSILINELMVSPILGDGSISSSTGSLLSTQRGEWIELYNPNICEPVDISCYYLGNYTSEGTGGFVIPSGTIVPAGGFCILRGANAASVPSNLLYVNGGNVVEIVFPPYINSEGNCTSGNRIWFPNAGGWFAFYDANGVVQDAVAWGPPSGTHLNDRDGNPCVPTRSGCTAAGSLMSYNQIPADRKAVASSVDAGSHMGQSIRRNVDGGTWNGTGTPTYGVCNSTCAVMGVSTCDGTATIEVEGGTAPYTYLWNDSQVQMTQTAVGLCQGVYEVEVSDAVGNMRVFEVEIVDFVPTVTVTIQETICVNSDAVQAQVSPVAQGTATGVLTGAGVTNLDFDPEAATVGDHVLVYDYTDENGCRNVDSTEITVNALPNLTWNINDSYCIPSSAHALTLSPTGGTLGGPGMSGTSFSPQTAGAGTHAVTYTFTDGNGCTNQIGEDVIVHQTIFPDIDPEDYLCVNGPLYTFAGNLNQEVVTMNGQNISSGIDPASFGVGNFMIIYSGVDANNCPSDTTVAIEIKALPELAIVHPALICSNVPEVSVTLSPTGGTLTGDLLVGTSIITAGGVVDNDYFLNYAYSDQFGCSNTAESTFKLINAIEPTLNYTTDCFFNANIVETYGQFTSVEWVTDGLASHKDGVYRFTYPDEGEYLITVQTVDQNGCPSEVSVLADIPLGLRMPDYQVPNVITANNDNVNDVLQMSAKYDECVDYEIVIVNRWGHHVFTATKYNQFRGFDKGGNEVGDGVYFFEVHSDDVDYNDELYKPYGRGFITVVK